MVNVDAIHYQESIKATMISLIPSKQISIETNLSVDVAVGLISHIAYTEHLSLFQRYIWFEQFGKPYEGYTSPAGFRIKGRLTAWGSPFLTVLDGKFIQTPEGLRVNVHSTLRPLAIIFLLTCLIGIAVIFLALIYNWITTGNFFNERAYLVLGLLIFLYILVYFLARVSEHTAKTIMIWLFTKKTI